MVVDVVARTKILEYLLALYQSRKGFLYLLFLLFPRYCYISVRYKTLHSIQNVALHGTVSNLVFTFVLTYSVIDRIGHCEEIKIALQTVHVQLCFISDTIDQNKLNPS